jgi:hypothetical protein
MNLTTQKLRQAARLLREERAKGNEKAVARFKAAVADHKMKNAFVPADAPTLPTRQAFFPATNIDRTEETTEPPIRPGQAFFPAKVHQAEKKTEPPLPPPDDEANRSNPRKGREK